jgi:regulator of protease activity HflC (stomatin/prohibitin superfamily)
VFWKRVHVRQHERALLFRRGDFVRLMQPGRYWVWRPGGYSTELADTLATQFAHKLLDLIAVRPGVEAELRVIELADEQRALVWKNGALATICGAGRYAFWRTPARLEIEVCDVRNFQFEHPRLSAILAHPAAGRFLDAVTVPPQHQALLFRDGRLTSVLEPGLYVFWKQAGQLAVRPVDRREQLADVAGQEIMTSDKVTLRVNLLVSWQVVDAVRAATVVSDVAQAVYREAQLALRAAVGTRTLDALLADKEAMGREVQGILAPRGHEFGVVIRAAGMRDIILPGEMKAILNQVIAAEKQAQANLIKRREETAAARNQANTARLLAENPGLARLRELEALQEILAGAKATFVLGPGDLAAQVRTLIRTEPVAGD